jgi:hypothetical protein
MAWERSRSPRLTAWLNAIGQYHGLGIQLLSSLAIGEDARRILDTVSERRIYHPTRVM